MSTMPMNQLPTPIQVPSMAAAPVAPMPAPPSPALVTELLSSAPHPSAPHPSGPHPSVIAPVPAMPSSATTTGRRNVRRLTIVGLAVAVATLAGVGAVAASATGGGHDGGGNRGSGGNAGNAAISERDVAGAYGSEFGVAPSDDTLACVMDEVSSDVAPSIQALLDGKVLSFDDTRAAILPFTTCAPDEDFLVNIVTASLILEPMAEESCVRSVLADSNAGARADALAMSIVDPQQFADRLYNTIAGCV
ncbi:MAG: hypothetical protein AB7V43_01505 [Acidimicrobiia bacterium]